VSRIVALRKSALLEFLKVVSFGFMKHLGANALKHVFFSVRAGELGDRGFIQQRKYSTDVALVLQFVQGKYFQPS